MRLGLVGLGKMGSQIAEKLLDAGVELVVDSRHDYHTDPLVARGAQSFSDYADLAAKLGERPIVWLMIPCEKVSAEIDQLATALSQGSIIVDGGNSNFNDTRAHAEKVQTHGHQLIDVGMSGGVWGRANGFSMMVGGEDSVVERLKPILDELAKPSGAWHHFGGSGAGHYVKMVHNGIEYGLMQSFAEGYRLLKEGPVANLDLGKVAEIWQNGSINQSFLNGLIEHIMKENPELDGVDGVVAESGEGRWTLETAEAQNISLPTIAAALAVRRQSQQGATNYSTKLLAQLRNEFGGHAVNPSAK